MTPHRIDIHHHVIPDAYLKAMKRAGVGDPIAGVAYPRWDVEADLDVMDRHGIQTAVVSITAPGVGFVEGDAAARVARSTNEAMAQLVADHPTRYGAFALIPLPDVNAALREIDFALDVLGLDGVGLFTNHRGTYLGDPAFDRVFAQLAERDALIHVHPVSPAATDQPGFGLPPSLYEYPFDTTRMVANLLYSGTLDRHPGLRMILSHAGGVVPFLAQRLTYAATINPKLASREPHDLLGSLRRLYYDTAMSANPHTLAALTSLVGTDRILFGTDYPFMPESTTAETIAGIGDFFHGSDLVDVEQNNAAALLPRLAKIRA
ncbi:amidohydrolase family protein [Streptomyces sp. NPDC059627]